MRPVSGHWKEVNKITRKWAKVFKDLENKDLLRGGPAWKDPVNYNGKNCSRIDLFCLWRVYCGAIEDDLAVYYEASRLMKKRKSTLNPLVKKETKRKWDLYLNQLSYATNFSEEEVAAAAVAGESACPNAADGPSITDPLQDPAVRAARDAYGACLPAESPLELVYEKMREFTKIHAPAGFE